MKPVQGYLTTDGTFFSSKSEARLHEATAVITRLCESHTPQPIQPDRFLILLTDWGTEIKEFIDANEAAKKHQAGEDTSTTGEYTTDDSNGDVEDAAVEQFPFSGHDNMPNMGNSTRTESVPKRGKKHGVGSGGGNA